MASADPANPNHESLNRFMQRLNNLQFKACKEKEAKYLLARKYKDHLAKAKSERSYYNKNTSWQKNKKKTHQATFIYKYKARYYSVDATAHYSYDWAQNVHVPHSDQQIGKMYYLSAHKVYLFGIQDKAVREQINYMLDENELIGKGPNSTLSLIFDGIKKLNKGEKNLKITCDNAEGQNKNNTTIWFYLYLLWTDQNALSQNHVDCVDHVVNVAKRSSIVGINKALRYNGSEDFQYFDILSSLEIHFKLLGMQNSSIFFLLLLSLAWSKPKKPIYNDPFHEYKLLKTKKSEASRVIKKIKALSICNTSAFSSYEI